MAIHHLESRGAVGATPERVFAHLDDPARLPPGAVVTQHEPPHRKAWETPAARGTLAVGSYGMGFEITPGNGHTHLRSHLRVFIDYTLPDRGVAGWLGKHFGDAYARSLVEHLVTDTIGHFDAAAVARAPAPLGPRQALGHG